MLLGAPLLRPGRRVQLQLHISCLDCEGPAEEQPPSPPLSPAAAQQQRQQQGLGELRLAVALFGVSGSHVPMLHLRRTGQIRRDPLQLLAGKGGKSEHALSKITLLLKYLESDLFIFGGL